MLCFVILFCSGVVCGPARSPMHPKRECYQVCENCKGCVLKHKKVRARTEITRRFAGSRAKLYDLLSDQGLFYFCKGMPTLYLLYQNHISVESISCVRGDSRICWVQLCVKCEFLDFKTTLLIPKCFLKKSAAQQNLTATSTRAQQNLTPII